MQYQCHLLDGGLSLVYTGGDLYISDSIASRAAKNR